MKRKILILSLVLLCLSLMTVLTSCLEGLSMPDFNDATNGSLESSENEGESGNGENDPETDPENQPEVFKIKYVYKIPIPGSSRTETKTVIRQEIAA